MSAPASWDQDIRVPRLMTIAQVANVLSVSPRTVKTWIACGILPSVLLGARCRRVDARDLAEFIESGRAKARAPRRKRQG